MKKLPVNAFGPAVAALLLGMLPCLSSAAGDDGCAIKGEGHLIGSPVCRLSSGLRISL